MMEINKKRRRPASEQSRPAAIMTKSAKSSGLL